MRRSALTQKQKIVALLVALGQHNYQTIAKQAGIHYNTIAFWLKDERVKALVDEFQKNIQEQLEHLAVESTSRDNTPLIMKATEKLHQLLESKSAQKQMHAIEFLLGGTRPQPERHEHSQPERPSLIRLQEDIIPRSRGQAKPHDFCSGSEPGYCWSIDSAMLLPRRLP